MTSFKNICSNWEANAHFNRFCLNNVIKKFRQCWRLIDVTLAMVLESHIRTFEVLHKLATSIKTNSNSLHREILNLAELHPVLHWRWTLIETERSFYTYTTPIESFLSQLRTKTHMKIEFKHESKTIASFLSREELDGGGNEEKHRMAEDDKQRWWRKTTNGDDGDARWCEGFSRALEMTDLSVNEWFFKGWARVQRKGNFF